MLHIYSRKVIDLEEERLEGKQRQQVTWLSLYVQKPHFRLCSNKTTGPPSSSDTTKACQVAGRTRAISQGRRAPRMQPGRLALLCTVLAFICFGREPANPEAGGWGRRVGKELVIWLDCAFLHLIYWVKIWGYLQRFSCEQCHQICHFFLLFYRF